MITQKEEILNLVKIYTQNHILDSSYEFNETSAYSLAVDLKIDRTNVSRLLNKLHQENKLIKIKGRPTLFIAREIIQQNFPYVSLPDTLSKNDRLQDYLYLTTSTSQLKTGTDLNVLSIEESNSMFNTVRNLLPIIYYPQDEVRIMLLSGPIGTGKKFFLQQLLEKGQQIGLFNQKQNIYYLAPNDNWSEILWHLKISPAIIGFRLPDNYSVKKTIELIDKLVSFFYNAQEKTPIVALLVSQEIDIDYSEITPYSGHFLPLAKRPLKERLEIILTLLQQESIRLKRSIVIEKRVLKRFAAPVFQRNISQLKQELIFSISHAFLNKTSTSTIQITVQHLSDWLKSTYQQEEDNDLWQELPESIQLSPEKELNVEEILNSEETTQLTTRRKKGKLSLKQFICTLPTNLNYHYIENKNNSFVSSLKNILEESDLIKDPVLIEFIIQTVQNNQYDQQLFSIRTSFDKNRPAQYVFKRMIRLINRQLPTFSESNQLFLKDLIYSAFEVTNEINIPILISSKGSQNADYLAQYFNQLLEKRMLFSINSASPTNLTKNEVSKYVTAISSALKGIDRGGGTIFITDYKPTDEIDNKVLLEIRLLTFTSYPPTFTTIHSLLESLKQKSMSVASLSSMIIKKRNDEKKFWQSQSFQNTTEREQNKIFNLLTDLFPHINTYQTNRIFYDLLIQITNEKKLIVSNQMIIDFIFQANAITDTKLNSSINKENDPILNFDEHSLAAIVAKKIQESKQLASLTFDPTDIETLANSISMNLIE